MVSFLLQPFFALCIHGSILNFTLTTLKVFEPPIDEEARRLKEKKGEGGLGKGISMGEISSWPLNSLWGGVACMLDACGPLHEYGDAPQMLVLF